MLGILQRRRSAAPRISGRRTAPLRLLVLLGASGLTAASEHSSSSSSSGSTASGSSTAHGSTSSHGASVADTQLCRLSPWNGSTAIVEACTKLSAAELANDAYCTEQIATARTCDSICPFPGAPDRLHTCSENYHTTWSHHNDELKLRHDLQWTIFFLCIAGFIGAFSKMAFPSWLPYTVGLLIIGVILGVLAQLASGETDCPWKAFVHDHDHDGHISHDEWDEFVCKDCHPDSFCALDYDGGRRRTCWDRVSNSSEEQIGGCRWSFNDLDQSWHKAFLIVETATYKAGNGILEADELWTLRCNLLRDMLDLSDIDPHVLLVVFLPALLFESACFGLDIGIFKMQIVQILLMAFPAMIMASGVTGALIYAANSGDWNFWPCWLIGIISSATDPVAVVALLKDLGAPKTLGTLIEGESLLNDGSAIVLYTWVKNAIGYDSTTLPPSWMDQPDQYAGQIGYELLRVVSQMLLLGVSMGLLGGFLLRGTLRRVYNDKHVEASLLLSAAYLMYWFCELIMGASAVIAVVVMGLYLNYHKESFSPDCVHFLHELFEMVAYLLNTIIFAIAGVRLGTLMADSSFVFAWGRINWPIIYPVILFARGFTIVCFFPLLTRFGTGCHWKEAFIMWWGGLRGSVGLALAIQIDHTRYSSKMWGDGDDFSGFGVGFGQHTKRLDCRDIPMEFLLMTVFVVFMTVVVNGMTMAPVMRLLKMTEIPDDRKFMLNAATRKLANQTTRYISKLKGQKVFDDVQWGYVDTKKCTTAYDFKVDDPGRAAWLQVLNIERASYLSQFESGKLGSEAFLEMEAFMATLNAKAAHTAGEQLSPMYDREFEVFLKSLLSSKDPRRLKVACEVAMAYIKGQQEVQHSAKIGVEGGEFNRWYNVVKREHDDNLEQMVLTLQTLQVEFPEVVKDFKDGYAAGLVLHHQRDMVEHMLHEGELPDLDANNLLSDINKKLKQLYFGTFRHDLDKELHTIRRQLTSQNTIRLPGVTSSNRVTPIDGAAGLTYAAGEKSVKSVKSVREEGSIHTPVMEVPRVLDHSPDRPSMGHRMSIDGVAHLEDFVVAEGETEEAHGNEASGKKGESAGVEA